MEDRGPRFLPFPCYVSFRFGSTSCGLVVTPFCRLPTVSRSTPDFDEREFELELDVELFNIDGRPGLTRLPSNIIGIIADGLDAEDVRALSQASARVRTLLRRTNSWSRCWSDLAHKINWPLDPNLDTSGGFDWHRHMHEASQDRSHQSRLRAFSTLR